MTAIKCIPTEYNGTKFRSRLEARWAVFFDSLRVDWRYEYEGYQLPSGWYLPDFWLPTSQTFVEIKGEFPTPLEQKLATELGEVTSKKVVIMNGDVGRCDSESGHLMAPHWNNCYRPTICSKCALFGFEFEGDASRLETHLRTCTLKETGYTYPADEQLLIRAADLANGFQFQFRHRR